MATITGNEYDHITISDGTDQTVHYLKDTAARADIDDLKSAITNNNTLSKLHAEELDGTTQTIVYGADGQISQILHKYTGTETLVRTDAFTFGTTQIVETRTLAAGDTMTITTNLENLETTVATFIVPAV